MKSLHTEDTILSEVPKILESLSLYKLLLCQFLITPFLQTPPLLNSRPQLSTMAIRMVMNTHFNHNFKFNSLSHYNCWVCLAIIVFFDCIWSPLKCLKNMSNKLYFDCYDKALCGSFIKSCHKHHRIIALSVV
jgi:hypothetical protein